MVMGANVCFFIIGCIFFSKKMIKIEEKSDFKV